MSAKQMFEQLIWSSNGLDSAAEGAVELQPQMLGGPESKAQSPVPDEVRSRGIHEGKPGIQQICSVLDDRGLSTPH